jgi:hypothetical protein
MAAHKVHSVHSMTVHTCYHQLPRPPDSPYTSDTCPPHLPTTRSYYAMVQSAPSMKQYFFVYKVRIANEGSQTVQLLSRHWVISDGDGTPSHVR